MASEGKSFLNDLAVSLGSSEPALRLLITILSGYPLAFLYRSICYRKSADIQHVFFAMCGIAMCSFNFGFDVYHSMGSVCVVYLLLRFKGGTRFSVWFAYIYFMGYLIIAYYLTETEDYDIIWTMPHCVLTLRIIGIVVDVYDGAKKDKISASQKELLLKKRPSFLEIFGFAYFFGGFMVGPQLPMIRYLKFVNGDIIKGKDLPNSVMPGMRRFATGLVCLVCLTIGNIYVPTNYVLSENFNSSSILMKFVILGIWGQLAFLKYITCWIIAEGSCTVIGITYNQLDANGNELWNGCANVHMLRFWTATQHNHFIQSFNILTNKWAAHYIYKRLQFFGNKLISQAITLTFLSIWHGCSFGYHCCFALEFCCTKLERDIGELIAARPSLFATLNNPIIKPIKLVLLKIFIIFTAGYCWVPFIMISWEKTHTVLSQVYYSGHIMYFGWLFIYPITMALLKSSTRKVKPE